MYFIPVHESTSESGALRPHRHAIEGTHRKVPVNTFSLRHISHEIPSLAVRSPVNLDLPRSFRHQVETGLEQGALTGPVWPHHSDQFALRDVQVDVPDHRLAVISHREVVNGERKVARVLRTPLGGGAALIDKGLHHLLFTHSWKPPSGTVPPRARAMVDTLWSIIPT